ncbi:glucose-6-phosphate exchanger SLC37A2-like [Oppia nitens]|uniref:glucose-6-phosphate exchanger SLC37A2-like n=1 Tax=Oppia nitens TaxID=1686743 RepID=UPI0023DAE5C2|nr:glucose-6-phosphate exchanger SLC37A2-like [Oppia nitens]
MGTLDLVFLLSYSISMYINGMIAERMNLRYFLTIGMLIAGIANILFGLAYKLNIHALEYFYVIQVLTGIGQSSCWPAIMSSMGNWFGPTNRGLVFGIWNSHSFLGNIVGSAIAGIFVGYDWGLSFIVPGVIVCGIAIVVFLTLVHKPEIVELSITLVSDKQNTSNKMNDNLNSDTNSKAISIIGALKISGVVEFALSLFFVKLVSYTFLDWLPYYISQTNANISMSNSAYMTMMFDVGGIAGAIIVGYIKDKTNASALTCIFMLIFSIPLLVIYRLYGNISYASNESLQFFVGLFVNAPYSLIITAVSAELGLKSQSQSALSTVTAIIDATGSLGSAVGPSLSGYVSEFGWNYVFLMVIIAEILGILFRPEKQQFQNNRLQDERLIIKYLISGKAYRQRNGEYMKHLSDKDIENLVKHINLISYMTEDGIQKLVNTYHQFMTIRKSSQEFWQNFITDSNCPQHYMERYINAKRLTVLTNFLYELSVARQHLLMVSSERVSDLSNIR